MPGFVVTGCAGLLALLFAANPLTAAAGKQKPELDKFLAALKSKDPAARLQAVVALADLGPAAAPAVPPLLELLRDKNEDLRLNAALALGKVGKPAVAPLTEALQDPDADARFYAVW